MPRPFWKHNLAHVFFGIFASKAQVQSLYIPFGWDWNGSEWLIFCLENFKLQSWKIKIKKWHEPSSKSEITEFYMRKNSKFTGSFSWGCLCNIDFCGFSDIAFDPHISSIIHFVVDHLAKLVLLVCCWSRWFTSTNPKNLTAFTSAPTTSYTGE